MPEKSPTRLRRPGHLQEYCSQHRVPPEYREVKEVGVVTFRTDCGLQTSDNPIPERPNRMRLVRTRQQDYRQSPDTKLPRSTRSTKTDKRHIRSFHSGTKTKGFQPNRQETCFQSEALKPTEALRLCYLGRKASITMAPGLPKALGNGRRLEIISCEAPCMSTENQTPD
jgi:hypothetical protein